jgi:predicted  nucleic acid-binding Zn-ribbon protein
VTKEERAVYQREYRKRKQSLPENVNKPRKSVNNSVNELEGITSELMSLSERLAAVEEQLRGIQDFRAKVEATGVAVPRPKGFINPFSKESQAAGRMGR